MNDMQMTPNGSDPVGYAIVIVAAIVTIWTIVFAVRRVINPGETEESHPKRMILREDR